MRGGLPVTPSSTLSSPAASPVEPSGTDRSAGPEGINVAVQGLELRVRNVYTGQQILVSVEGHTCGHGSLGILRCCRH